MKMALTAGCLFLLQCFLLMDISVADPLIDVTPSEIILGTTLTLDINCTFSLGKHPDMAALISLVLSRANDTEENFEELAVITEFSPNSVTVLTQETVSTTGIENQKGDSFLHVKWQYPTALQGGVYRCSAHGLDNIGHNVDLTITSSVMVDEANLNDVFEKLKEMEMHESSMEQQIQNLENKTQTLENDKVSMGKTIQTLENDKTSMDQQIQTLVNKTQTLEDKTQTLENDKVSMEQTIQTLEKNKVSSDQQIQNLVNKTQTLENDKTTMENYIKSLEDRIEFITPLTFVGEYKHKSYYVSKHGFGDVNTSLEICRSFFGELATINDVDEFREIQGLLQAADPSRYVVIAGTDEVTEGEWNLPGTKTPMPYTSWQSGRPSNNHGQNCVALESTISYFMIDISCHREPPTLPVRLCVRYKSTDTIHKRELNQRLSVI